MILAIEIAGTRLLTPWFGAGLQVWATQIAVTMLAIAAGYFLGGRLTRGANPARAAAFGLMLSGIWIMAVPHLAASVLARALAFDWYPAIIISTIVLYLPPLVALAVISPVAIHILNALGRPAGTAAGLACFIGTIGGLLGAWAAAFVLIAHPVNRIFLASGFATLALGAAALARRASLAERLACAATIAIAAIGGWTIEPKSFGHMPGITPIDARLSHHGCVEVVENPQFRFLLIDNAVQTAVDKRTGDIHPSMKLFYSPMGFLRDALGIAVPEARQPRALVIGLGGGTGVHILRDAGYSVDVVEISPDVVAFARQHFGLNDADARIFIQDGRYFLNRMAYELNDDSNNKEIIIRNPGSHDNAHETFLHSWLPNSYSPSSSRYDLIFLDVYSGFNIAEDLYSLEAFERAKGCLNPGGLIVCNLVAAESHASSRRVAATLARAFGEADGFAVLSPTLNEGGGFDNLVLYAAKDAPVRERFDAARAAYERVNAEAMRLAGGSIRRLSFGGEASLTDNHNTLNWDRRETIHRLMQQRARERRAPSGHA